MKLDVMAYTTKVWIELSARLAIRLVPSAVLDCLVTKSTYEDVVVLTIVNSSRISPRKSLGLLCHQHLPQLLALLL